MVATDRDGIEFRHLLGGVTNNIRHNPHGGLGWIDVGVADHKFFQNVVLQGAGKLLGRHTLLFGGHDVTGHHREYRAVHGHRYRDLIERNAVK